MDNNLVSMKKFVNDVQSMKTFSFLMNNEQKAEIQKVEQQILHMTNQIELFNSRFSDSGWCVYDSINFPLVEKVNQKFENDNFEAAETVLLNYYKNDVKDIMHWLKSKSKELMNRYDLIKKAFEDHFEERYYASIPLFLIIIDGSVNDFTQSKGFFAEGTDVSAWDCLVGCSNSLEKLKVIFNKGRNKTNTEKINMPFRNGILHGRDLNYANEYVSCKCVALLFAVADWMNMKDSELQRKEKFEKEMNPPTLGELFANMKKNASVRKEIDKWKPRTITIGTTIKSSGEKDDYINYPYIISLLNMFDTWQTKNYGKLSMHLKNMFSYEKSDKKRAGECRSFFENKTFESFEIKEVEERACSLTRISVRVKWISYEKQYDEILEFGCVYQNQDGDTALPWLDNGSWILMPWNIHGLYKS